MEKKLKELEKIINYSFKNVQLLEISLTHKSFDNLNNNEKLEFLGDRVLGLVISEKLLEKYPEEKEGIIDKKFANLVNKNNLVGKAQLIFFSNDTMQNSMFKFWNLKNSFRLERLFKNL